MEDYTYDKHLCIGSRVMTRLLLILVLLPVISASAKIVSPNAQSGEKLSDKKITVTLRDGTLRAALEEISSTAQISIFFDAQAMSTITIKGREEKQAKVAVILNELLSRSSFTWKETGNSIVIVDRKKKEEKKIQQANKIRGVVLDSNDTPLPGATVLIKDSNVGTVTDLDGQFQLNNLSEGAYTLVVKFIGYRTEEVVVPIENLLGSPITIHLIEDITTLDGVVVKAEQVKNAEASVLRERKNSALVQDGISTEMMERTASITVTQALQKISGISIKDEKYVSVRGLADRNVVIGFNGARLSSADPLRSGAVPLDILPVQLVDNIAVQKTVLPNIPGDATGAVIELQSRALPDTLTISVTGQVGFSDNVGLGGKVMSFPNGNLGFFGQHAKEHQLSKEFITLAQTPLINFEQAIAEGRNSEEASAHALRINELQEQVDPYLATSLQKAVPNQIYAASISNTFKVFGEKRLGLLLGGNYLSKTLQVLNGKNNRYKLLENVTTPNNVQLSPVFRFREDQGSQNVLYGGVAAMHFKVNEDHAISANYILNKGFESIGTMLSSINNDNPRTTPDLYSYQLVTSIRTFNTFQAQGEHNLALLGYRPAVQWNYSTSLTNTELPDFRNSFLTRDQEYEVYNAYNITRYYRTLDEKNENLKLDLTLPVLNTSTKASVKTGVWFLKRRRDFFQASLLAPTDQKSAVVKSLAQVRGDLNNWLTPDVVGIAENRSAAGGLYAPGFNYYYTSGNPNGGSSKYNATQRISSAYVMADISIDNAWRLSGGMRVEDTDVRGFSDSTNTKSDIRSIQDYIDQFAVDQQEIQWLPSGTLIFKLNNTMNFRLAASRTLARPELVELVNFSLFDASQFAYVKGNNHLKNAQYANIDFRWEFFPNREEVFSISLFHKRVDNALEKVFLPQASTTFVPISSISFRNNPSSGTVFGIELEAVKYLSFLTPALKYARIGANMMLAKSETELSDEEYYAVSQYNRPLNRKRPLFDQPNIVLNGNLGYEWHKQGLVTTLYYSYVGRRLVEINSDGTPNIFEYSAPQLDFILSKTVGSKLIIKGFAKNLLDGRTDYIYQNAGSNTDFGVLNQTYYRKQFTKGREYSIGVSYVF